MIMFSHELMFIALCDVEERAVIIEKNLTEVGIHCILLPVVSSKDETHASTTIMQTVVIGREVHPA